MVSATALLDRLLGLGVRVEADGTHLLFFSTPGAVPVDVKREARAREHELLEALRGRSAESVESPVTTAPAWSLAAWADVLGPRGARMLPGDVLDTARLCPYLPEEDAGEAQERLLARLLAQGCIVGALIETDQGFVVAPTVVHAPPDCPGQHPWSEREAVLEFLARAGGTVRVIDLELLLGSDMARIGVEDLLALGVIDLRSDTVRLRP